jgi:hypothetical protein
MVGVRTEQEPDGTKGFLTFLTFAFDTQETITDILVGTYADYALGNYEAFIPSGVSTEGSPD